MMMKHTAFALAVALISFPAFSQTPEFHKLDISEGHWVFHGTTLKTRSGKPAPWTWNEDCRWSPNHLYLQCTFSNVWGGKPVESLVVDTYNTTDHRYWHYEFYSGGAPGDKPFVAPMDINGNTWIEHGEKGMRIVYVWDSPKHVLVTIEKSKDGVHWDVIDRGEGIKQE